MGVVLGKFVVFPVAAAVAAAAAAACRKGIEATMADIVAVAWIIRRNAGNAHRACLSTNKHFHSNKNKE
jgi:hypothetical protein